MAVLSALVRAIANVQGLDENQVLWIARYLREDGLIVQGGRGRGGARMSSRDAANLLIGVNAPGAAKEAAAMVQVFRDLPLARDYAAPSDESEWDYVCSDDDALSRAFRRGAPFGPALEAVISEFIEDERPAALYEETRVTFSGPFLRAFIHIGAPDPERARHIQFAAEFFKPQELIQANGEPPDQEVSKSFTHRTLIEVGRVLAT